MEFPGDIWIEIMSYFHSAYKVPLHYTSLVENKQFYFSREKTSAEHVDVDLVIYHKEGIFQKWRKYTILSI